jgi:hypothetical protein
VLILPVLAKAEEISGKQQIQNAAGAVGPQGPLLDCAREKAAPAIGQPPRLGDYLPAIIADPDCNGIEDRKR